MVKVISDGAIILQVSNWILKASNKERTGIEDISSSAPFAIRHRPALKQHIKTILDTPNNSTVQRSDILASARVDIRAHIHQQTNRGRLPKYMAAYKAELNGRPCSLPSMSGCLSKSGLTRLAPSLTGYAGCSGKPYFPAPRLMSAPRSSRRRLQGGGVLAAVSHVVEVDLEVEQPTPLL